MSMIELLRNKLIVDFNPFHAALLFPNFKNDDK